MSLTDFIVNSEKTLILLHNTYSDWITLNNNIITSTNYHLKLNEIKSHLSLHYNQSNSLAYITQCSLVIVWPRYEIGSHYHEHQVKIEHCLIFFKYYFYMFEQTWIMHDVVCKHFISNMRGLSRTLSQKQIF